MAVKQGLSRGAFSQGFLKVGLFSDWQSQIANPKKALLLKIPEKIDRLALDKSHEVGYTNAVPLKNVWWP